MNDPAFVKYSTKVYFWRSAPIAALSMIVFSLGTLVEAYFVGRWIGQSALEAVNLILPLLGIALVFDSVIGIGCAYTVSDHHARGEQRGVRETLCLAIILSVILGLLFAFMPPMTGRYFEIFKIESLELRTYCSQFIAAWSFLPLFYFLNNAVVASYRGLSRVGLASFFSMLPLALTIVFSPFLISSYGIAGAAYAQILAYFISAFLAFIHIARIAQIEPAKPKNWLLSSRRILVNGVFGGVLQVGVSYQQFLHIMISSNSGEHDVASLMGNLYRIFSVYFLGVMGIFSVMQPLIMKESLALDRQKMWAIWQYFVGMTTMFAAIFFVFFALFTQPIYNALFSYNIADKHAFWAQYFALSALFLPFELATIVVLQTLGQIKKVIALLVIRQFAILTLSAYGLSAWMGNAGLFASHALTDILTSCFALALLLNANKLGK